MNIPVILNYDYEELIGAARINEDGTVVITIIDQRVLDIIRYKEDKEIRAISLDVRPARSREVILREEAKKAAKELGMVNEEDIYKAMDALLNAYERR